MEWAECILDQVIDVVEEKAPVLRKKLNEETRSGLFETLMDQGIDFSSQEGIQTVFDHLSEEIGVEKITISQECFEGTVKPLLKLAEILVEIRESEARTFETSISILNAKLTQEQISTLKSTVNMMRLSERNGDIKKADIQYTLRRDFDKTLTILQDDMTNLVKRCEENFPENPKFGSFLQYLRGKREKVKSMDDAIGYAREELKIYWLALTQLLILVSFYKKDGEDARDIITKGKEFMTEVFKVGQGNNCLYTFGDDLYWKETPQKIYDELVKVQQQLEIRQIGVMEG